MLLIKIDPPRGLLFALFLAKFGNFLAKIYEGIRGSTTKLARLRESEWERERERESEIERQENESCIQARRLILVLPPFVVVAVFPCKFKVSIEEAKGLLSPSSCSSNWSTTRRRSLPLLRHLQLQLVSALPASKNTFFHLAYLKLEDENGRVTRE